METTGGHECALLGYLEGKSIAAHRGNARTIKNFIRSLRNYGKTDKIDALAIAQYGSERHQNLELYKAPSESLRKLTAFNRRRSELVKMRTADKNRLEGPMSADIADSLKRVIKALDTEIERIEKQIEKLVQQDKALSAKAEVMQTIPGIGKITAMGILSYLPAIGSFTRREIASLSGVAPHPYDSGDQQSYRSTRGGKKEIKPILFIAAMAASRGKHSLGVYYRRKIAEGKKPIVALTALMRKIIVIANARVRDLQEAQS